MKTKLTLTVDKAIIAKAKKIAALEGKSLSKLFEEIFGGSGEGSMPKNRKQAAWERLKQSLEKSPPLQIAEDIDARTAYRKHLDKKYGDDQGND